eukprot:TRINITY_DN34758_c0_g1_i1.p1 TRINITY_DN34758_c0_g1~~TRINITY_DN34758_c0_g1_i1.p1  ORF type:complete len:731 (+),score=118.07 TRINITY_DN34758_c0_g1_i1:103-2295(+)
MQRAGWNAIVLLLSLLTPFETHEELHEDLLESALSCSDASGGCDGTVGVSWLQQRARQVIHAHEQPQDNSQSPHRGQAQRQELLEENTSSLSSAQFCDTHTGGSCRFFGCHESRGPTDCRSYECRCKPGYCAVAGVCIARATKQRSSCGRNTGGTCNFLSGCKDFRGPTDCVNGQCICKPGWCSDDDGSCHKKHPPVKADVVAVNSHRKAFPGLHAVADIGVCFSGGGSRSLSATLGILRALEGLGFMKHVDAISSVSGGTWASAIYIFANQSTDELLGPETSPRNLTMEALQKQPPNLGNVATTNILSLLWGKLNVVSPHDLWIDTYARAILEPFGLANRSRYMAADEESVQRIIHRNPHLRREEFFVPQASRPKVFIMGGTLLGPQGFAPEEESAVSLQMSPDFTGSPFYPHGTTVHFQDWTEERLVGGGVVETFAFGGSAPISSQDQQGGTAVEMDAPSRPFSLAEAVGISSAAFAAVMVQSSYWVKALDMFTNFKSRDVLPVKDVWPVTSPEFPDARLALKFELGDGAETDNTGIMALLQRSVKKIAVFLNTNVALAEDIEFCSGDIMRLDLKGKVSNDLLDKFGYVAENKGEYLKGNKVFRAEDLQPLLCDLQKRRKSGDALVVKTRLEVQENGKWGIQGGWHVAIILCYLSRSENFDVTLPPETLEELHRGDTGKFAHWPNFKTVHQNRGKFTSYLPEQVNLLAGFGEYMVRSNSHLFNELLQP